MSRRKVRSLVDRLGGLGDGPPLTLAEAADRKLVRCHCAYAGERTPRGKPIVSYYVFPEGKAVGWAVTRQVYYAARAAWPDLVQDPAPIEASVAERIARTREELAELRARGARLLGGDSFNAYTMQGGK